ncbi:hypothetical protein LINPERHAP1_LOCUS23221 [Linum perenne]
MNLHGLVEQSPAKYLQNIAKHHPPKQIMEVTLKELYRARRARRTRPIFRSRYKDRLKQAYDYLIQRLQKKRQRVVRKIHMLQQRANQYNRGLRTVERFTINHPSCVCSYCGASMWREESTAPTRNHPQPTFYLCCNGGKVRVAPTRELGPALRVCWSALRHRA